MMAARVEFVIARAIYAARSMWTPLAIVLALLVGMAILSSEEEPEPVALTPVAEIARRVEALRGIRFEKIPEPVTVTTAQAREEGLADLDRGYPAAERAADEALYETLGLFPKGTDLEKVSASIFGEQVAGYYDPRDGRLRIVEGAAGSGTRVINEMIVAHELNHALEDQVFELDTEQAEESGDAGYAYRALVEGTASSLMYDYVGEHFKDEELFGGLLSSAFSVSSTTPLPRFVMEGLTFPYLNGAEFVAALRERADGGWKLLDLALRTRPPASTEQVLHPEKWIAVEAPLEVAPFELPEGWERVTGGVFGEWQTAQLIVTGGPVRPEASEGWGGDRYELWRRGGDDVALIRWRWDTDADADEFEDAIGLVVRDLGAAFARHGRETTLVAGPDAAEVLSALDGGS
jgi:hypothetical protein